MVRTPLRWFLLIVFFTLEESVSGSPQLAARQELWPDSPLPGIFGGAAALWDVGESIINNMFFSPNPADLSGVQAPPKVPETEPIPQTGRLLNPPQPTWPQQDPSTSQPNTHAPQYEEPAKVPPSQGGLADDTCGLVPGQRHGDISPSLEDTCLIHSDQIIYPSNCASLELNQAIEKALWQMNPPGGVLASKVRKCGVFFWAAKLTRKQLRIIEKMPGVRAVAPDEYIEELDGFPPYHGRVRDKRRRERDQLEKRNGFVVVQEDSLPDLAFISVSPDASMSDSSRYSYFSEAGEGVTVYSLDAGDVDQATSDLRIKAKLYSLDVAPSLSGLDDHATCIASKVSGLKFGVAKKVDLVVVVMGRALKSFLDGLRVIVNDIDRRGDEGEPVYGHTVVTISIGFRITSDINRTVMEQLFKDLLNEYQTVVVVSAGNDYFGENGPVFEDPALLSLKPEFPIITVGAVSNDGTTPGMTRTGPSVMVSAPGDVTCSGVGGRTINMQGTSFSAPAVAGLAAYCLSVYPTLRESKHIPRAVRDFIVDNAYVRPGGRDQAIWNLIYPDSRPGPPVTQ